MKRVELLGLDLEVEFDEAGVKWNEAEQMETVETTDGKLIGWDDAANSWILIRG